MGRYAQNTDVSVSKSQAEIRNTVMRYGATTFGIVEEAGKAGVVFERDGRRVMIEMFLPHPERPEFKRERNYRNHAAGEFDPERHEQACRTSWRALALVTKAKLEAVAAGISSFENEFLSFIVLPNGQRVGKWLTPQLEQSFKTGKMPPLLGAGS